MVKTCFLLLNGLNFATGARALLPNQAIVSLKYQVIKECNQDKFLSTKNRIFESSG